MWLHGLSKVSTPVYSVSLGFLDHTQAMIIVTAYAKAVTMYIQ